MIDIAILIKVGVIAAALATGVVSHYLLRLPKNNPVEQAAEQVIKDNTGLDVDFSNLPEIPVPSCLDSQDEDK